MHDVVVVGAGPSGSFAAMKCAEAGLDVMLLDAASFPRDKACGGVIGAKVMSLLGPDAMSVVEREGRHNDLFYNWKFVGHLQAHQFFVKRRKFDHYLVRRAVAAGAKLEEGCRATGLTIKSDMAVVHTQSGDHYANMVIGADGTNSVIGRSVGLPHNMNDFRFTSIKAEIDVNAERARELGVEDPSRQRTFFFSDLIGFAWIVPNEGSVNAGYGSTVDRAGNLKERFHRFLSGLGLAPQHERGAQLPFKTTRRVFADRVLLTGDAGGFVNPWTGCGIEDALLASGKAAVVCAWAAESQDYSATMLSRYQRLTRPMIRRVNWRGSWIKALDRLIPNGAGLPSWVGYIVPKCASLASAA